MPYAKVEATATAAQVLCASCVSNASASISAREINCARLIFSF